MPLPRVLQERERDRDREREREDRERERERDIERERETKRRRERDREATGNGDVGPEDRINLHQQNFGCVANLDTGPQLVLGVSLCG